MRKTSLDTVGSDVLLHVVDFILPTYDDRHKRRIDMFTFPPEDIKSLASVSKSLRVALAPVLWKAISLSDRKEEFGGTKTKFKCDCSAVEELLKKDYILHNVRMIQVGPSSRDFLLLVAEAIKKMKNLKFYNHSLACPIPRCIGDALRSLSHLDSFDFTYFFVESLPKLKSWPNPIRYLRGTASIMPNMHPDTNGGDPIIPNRNLRTAPEGSQKLPTLEEHVKALGGGLASVVFEAASSLECFDFNSLEPEIARTTWFSEWCCQLKKLGGGKMPEFPKLERLYLCLLAANRDFYQMIKSSPWLTHICFSQLSKTTLRPPSGHTLPYLKLMHLIVEEGDFDAPAGALAFVKDAKLLDLELNGINGAFLTSFFNDEFSGASLRRLELLVLKNPLRLPDFQAVCDACPNLLALSMMGIYRLEMTEILDEISLKLHKIVELQLDHPWEAHEALPFNMSNGRTIRSDKHQSFRVISITKLGRSLGDEIRSRIRADIKACAQLYRKRITKFARKCPTLESFYWHATDEVLWTWSFSRGSGRLIVTDEVDIAIKDSDKRSVPTSCGVFMRMPTS